MSAVSFNLGNYNRAMSEHSRRSTNSGKSGTNNRLEPIKSSRPANMDNINHNHGQPKYAVSTRSGNQLDTKQQGSNQNAGTGSEVEYRQTNKSNFDAQSIRDEMKKAFLSNPNVKIDDEAEYYETVRRLDVCGGCWTGQQKYYTNPFKLKHKSPGNTIYQKDYVKHPLDGKGPVLKNDFYNTFNADEPMDFGTTMKNDYKPWNVNAPARANGANKSSASGIPFGGRSGYKADYINWGAMPVNIEKAPNTISVIKELPFMAKTSYGDNYGDMGPNEQVKPFNRKNQKNPLSPSVPFLGETTHNKTFKPFKVSGAPMFPNDDEYEPTEAYPDQYKSLYKQDYDAPPKWKCPARIFMETHTHPRQKYFKS